MLLYIQSSKLRVQYYAQNFHLARWLMITGGLEVLQETHGTFNKAQADHLQDLPLQLRPDCFHLRLVLKRGVQLYPPLQDVAPPG